MQVISLKDQKDIALEVKVSNLNGDDAYEADVTVTFPRSLTYSTYHDTPGVSLSSSVSLSLSLSHTHKHNVILIGACD